MNIKIRIVYMYENHFGIIAHIQTHGDNTTDGDGLVLISHVYVTLFEHNTMPFTYGRRGLISVNI